MSTLNTAISGLLAFQRALATTSHNIANVATPGYSRQVVEFATRFPLTTEGGYIGNGVNSLAVTRMQDAFLTQQIWARSSSVGFTDIQETLTGRIGDIVADPSGSLAPAMQDFFSALQDMADNPSDMPSRQMVLTRASILGDRFHQLNSQLDDMRRQVGEQTKSVVSEINSYAKSIADINLRIMQSNNAGSGQANDLLDQREAMVEQLSKLVHVTTLAADNGSLSVFIGNGQTLVINSSAANLAVNPDPYDAREQMISYNTADGAASFDITAQVNGGQLGGLLEFKNGLLMTTQNEIGRVAAGLTAMVNDQHRLGMDYYNNLGGDFFEPLAATSAEVLANRNNTGNAQLSAQITDYSQLSDSDYVLTYSGGNYSLRRLADDTVTNLGAAAPNQEVDGVTFSIASGAMSDGDSILVRPLRNAASQFSLALTQPQQVAAASPVRINHSSFQLDGNASISGVNDTGNAAFATAGSLSPPVLVRFLSANSYELVDAGSMAVMETGIAYNPTTGADIFPTPGGYDPGYQVHLQGNFAAGDNFTVEYNSGGVSDNRNALLLDQLRSVETMLDGSANLAESYSRMVGRVGSEAREAQLNAQTQTAMLSQAQNQKQEISGVNLDEEAANLVRFQQAYQAAAQVISVSKTMFDSLIMAFR